MNRLSGLLGSFVVVLATLAGCGTDVLLPGNGTPAELRVSKGNNQIGPAGSPLAEPLEVKVVDDQGAPLSGHTVAFALGTEVPRARLDPANARSGQDGIAQSRWTLGATSGTQEVVARVPVGSAEPLEIRFTASAQAGAAQALVKGTGDAQSAEAGTRIADPLVVSVTDEFGNPVEGVSVEWATEQGSVDPTSSLTGADGRAQTVWTLGAATGAQAATASSGSLSGSPVGFTATGHAGGADRLLQVSGDGQSASPGTELENPLVVQLVDRAGNGVPNRPVSWVIATGGGTTQPGTSTTDDEGLASTRWTLGPGGSQNTLNAVVSGVGVVGFAATGGGGGATPDRLEFLVQPSDTREDRRISPAVEVVVLDQSGNRVTEGEFEIKLELQTDDRGKLHGDRTRRTEAGVARFSDLEVDRDGEYRLRASTDGLPSIESDRFEVQDD